MITKITDSLVGQMISTWRTGHGGCEAFCQSGFPVRDPGRVFQSGVCVFPVRAGFYGPSDCKKEAFEGCPAPGTVHLAGVWDHGFVIDHVKKVGKQGETVKNSHYRTCLPGGPGMVFGVVCGRQRRDGGISGAS